MKLWMHKILVAVIAVITLGIYVPDFDTDVEAKQRNTEVDTDSKTETTEHDSPPVLTADLPEIDEANQIEDPILALSHKASEQALMKMGPRIADKVADELKEDILPKIEEALYLILDETSENDYQYFSITEQPSEGVGERIFNVYDERNGKDIARFDVRREKRPTEGYWFNFHYHVSSDGFEEHHEIGEIYWDKNIPPKWMA